jgi:hypothetical protein
MITGPVGTPTGPVTVTGACAAVFDVIGPNANDPMTIISTNRFQLRGLKSDSSISSSRLRIFMTDTSLIKPPI